MNIFKCFIVTKMGTPIRSLSTLISPKFFTPLSPRLRVPSRENDTLIGKRQHFKENNNLVVKKLDFQDIPGAKTYYTSPIRINIETVENNQIKGKRRRDILVNTPMKVNIIKNGLEEQKLLNILGKGNFGKVVKGIYKGEAVAVKVIKNTKNSTKERNALDLDHLNLVKLLEITENRCEKFSVIIMEYYPDSQNLQTYMENKQNCLDDKLLLFSRNVCQGLKYCHQKGVLHLDIKPQNILICGDVCKICDFGNSCRKNETETFQNNGTVYYTAPELLEGMEPTEKCDIYSLGILFWQMKHRKIPYEEFDNIESVIYQVVKLDLRPDFDIPDGAYAKLYNSCWRKEYSSRPDIFKVLEILDNIQ